MPTLTETPIAAPGLTPAQRRAAIARAARLNDPEALANERREYAVARLEDYIKRTVAKAPPLSAEQRERLAALLTTGGAA